MEIHIRGRLRIVIGQNIITVIILPFLYILILTEICISIMREASGNEGSHILTGCSKEMAAL
jgi:hypothetical protein